MRRITAGWFVLAGALALVRWGFEYRDVAYYDPQSVADYGAVVLQTGAGLATGVALLLVWREPPVPRGAFLLPVAGLGAISQGLGNLLEDAFDLESAVWLFFIGGIGMIITLAAAGIAALTVQSSARRTGLLYVAGATGGMLGFGLAIMGLAWIAMAVWLVREQSDTGSGSSIGARV